MTARRILVFCPDYDAPSGGVRRLYRHVDVLRRHGFEAAIVHEKPGFRCSWFANETPVRARSQVTATPSDFLVLPEILGPNIAHFEPGVPKVIFNQNAYLTFAGYPLLGPNNAEPYWSEDVKAVFTVSEDNLAYLQYAFPKQKFVRLHYGIDPLFAPSWPKRRVLAYMPRKNAPEIVQVFNLLRCRGVLDGWDLVAIDKQNESQVAATLASAAGFFSFGYPEGCPLPPLEAMASGCAVVGYHGWGGREYFRQEFSWPVEAGDVLEFARTAEEVLAQAAVDPMFLEQRGRAARAFVLEHYSCQREESDIVSAWKAILDAVPPALGTRSDTTLSAPNMPPAIASTSQERTEAIQCWRRSARPDPDAGLKLVKACIEAGDNSQAIELLRDVIALRPDWYDAVSQLGILLGAAGRNEEAITAFKKAIELRPASAQAHQNLGVACLRSGRVKDGVAALEQALERDPAYADAHYNLANAFSSLGHRDDAIAHYRQALAERPDYPEALNNLGLRLIEAGKPAEAVALLGRARQLGPRSSEYASSLGIALETIGRFDEAERVLLEAIEYEPASADAHANLGNVYKARGCLAEAIAAYDRSLALRPDSASTRYNRSLALLLGGDYARGWAEYEWRLDRGSGRSRCPSAGPAWDGSPGQGRAILVWAEQGLGDVLQFVRFAPLLKARDFRVYVHVPGILHGIVRSLKGIDWLAAEGDILPKHDVHCPLMSLPYRLGVTLDHLPATVPYLRADAARTAAWKQSLGQVTGRKVGLYWQGNPHHALDRWRSLRLSELLPFGDVPGVELVSLQQGPGREQVQSLPANNRVVHPDDSYKTIDDLAAAIDAVDLVISVDTATAHLAGALGKPVWILLSATPDWRWLLNRVDSPWYPNARLFRQERLGDWSAPLATASEQLKAWTEGSAA